MELYKYMRVVNDYIELIKLVGHYEVFKSDINEIIDELENTGDETAIQFAKTIKLIFN